MRVPPQIEVEEAQKKDLGAILRTQRTQLDDFLEKNNAPTALPLPLTQSGMDPFLIKVTQGKD